MKPLLAIAALVSGLFTHGATLAEVPADAVWIDVRTAEEFAGGHLEGAHNIPHEKITTGVAGLGLDQEAPIYLYCRSGNRSGIATDSLVKEGYTRVINAGSLEDARVLAQKKAN